MKILVRLLLYSLLVISLMGLLEFTGLVGFTYPSPTPNQPLQDLIAVVAFDGNERVLESTFR